MFGGTLNVTAIFFMTEQETQSIILKDRSYYTIEIPLFKVCALAQSLAGMK